MPRSQDQGNHREHIKKTLHFLIRQKYFSESGFNVRHLSIPLERLKSDYPDWYINISHLEIPILNKDLSEHDPKILIGGIIQAKGDKIVYSTFSISIIFTTVASELSSQLITLNVPSCCLRDYANKRRIVRHFHFDFQPESNVEPVSHFQYGGHFPEGGHYSDCHYCLEHKLTIPRIFFPPMDIVLVIDLIIREFDTPLKHLTQEQEWRQLVYDSQKLLWKNYWENSIRYLRSGHGKTFLESIYGNENG